MKYNTKYVNIQKKDTKVVEYSLRRKKKMGKKLTAVLAYFSLLLWVIAYVVGDKEGAKHHLNQALVLNLASIIAGIVSNIIPIVGLVSGIIILVFAIMGIVAAVKGEDKKLPIIGDIQILK